MTFFPDPIQPGERKQEEEIQVNRIEAVKKEKEKDPLPENGKPFFYGSFLLFMQKIFSLLSRKEESLESSFSGELATHLQELKELFEKLQNEDLSQDAHFCETFSQLWHEIKKELDLVRRAKSSTLIDLKRLEALLREISRYPADVEHSLGHYLIQYAGEKWLPLPFMEMLFSLHARFLEKREESELARWVLELGSLLDIG